MANINMRIAAIAFTVSVSGIESIKFPLANNTMAKPCLMSMHVVST